MDHNIEYLQKYHGIIYTKEVIKSLNECTDKWHKKEHIDIKVLNEWKSSVITQINKKIKKLKNTNINININKKIMI